MSRKETKIGRSVAQRLKRTGVHSRVSLCRSENVTKRTANNTRAQIISQLVYQPGEYPYKEFASYFYGNSRNAEPIYSLTSHGVKYAHKRRSDAPTYPVLGLRWNPYVESSSIENFATDFEGPIQYTCRCNNCKSKRCPSRVSSSSTLKPNVFKTNIMTFKDKFTMTPKVKDANCGCSSVESTPRQSQVSINTSGTTIKDNQSHNFLHECPQRYTPMPILKKQDDFIYKPYSCCHQNEKTDLHDIAERDIDTCNSVNKNLKSKSFGSFFKLSKKGEHKKDNESRKMLYNEGISDSIANKYLKSPIRVPSPRNLKDFDKASKVSVTIKSVSHERSYKNSECKIPFSHRSDSKYHYRCKKACSKNVYETNTDEMRHLVASPEIVARRYARKPIKYHKVPSIKLPKRVLTSERDIEFYIDNNKMKIQIADGRQSV